MQRNDMNITGKSRERRSRELEVEKGTERERERTVCECLCKCVHTGMRELKRERESVFEGISPVGNL